MLVFPIAGIHSRKRNGDLSQYGTEAFQLSTHPAGKKHLAPRVGPELALVRNRVRPVVLRIRRKFLIGEIQK
jgi:hypothetical protein